RDLMCRQLEFQLALLDASTGGRPTDVQPPDLPAGPANVKPEAIISGIDSSPGSSSTPLSLDRNQWLEFAGGSIAAVLGPHYAAVDRFPTRVRLPDEPLMLVDRILAIEGQPCSLQEGRVVTEHVIERDAWYLDGDRIPPSIAIEAGQADLFLS